MVIAKKMKWLDPADHTFGSISGHDIVKQYLQSAMEGNMLPHALLFHGPKGLGKMSMAYALTKRLNCRDGAPTGCECNVCRKISEGIFADILVVEPRGAAGQITLAGWKPGKDDPDNLQHYRFVDSRPMEGACKVVIIRMADRMNIAMANFILKLMEEPPSYLKLILVTHRRNDLLATIRSRCAPVKFSPLQFDEIRTLAAKTLGQASTDADADALARLADGRPGQLAAALDEGGAQQRAEMARMMKQFRKFGFVTLFRTASDLQDAFEAARSSGATSHETGERILSALTAWLRDAAICKTLPDDKSQRYLVYGDQKQDLREFAAEVPLDAIVRSSQCIQEYLPLTNRQMDRSFILESLLMQLGRTMRPA